MENDEHPVVWAVCEDERENNGPVVVFTTKALADEHCFTLNLTASGNHDVRKLPLLSTAPQQVTWHWRQICVREADGVTVRHKQPQRNGWDYDHADPLVEVVHPRGATVINVWATTDEAALAACEAELARREAARLVS